MEGNIGSTISKWWRVRSGDCGRYDRKPDISPRRSICRHQKKGVYEKNLLNELFLSVFLAR
jgi:hypothetical protein